MTRRFEENLLPHLNAAFNLARWITGDAQDAEDVVQDACLKAFKALDTLQPASDPRAWLLTIVRNTGWNWLRRKRGHVVLGEHGCDPIESSPDPEAALLRDADIALLRRALEALPVDYREVLVLREMEAMSYREIAEVIGAPIGTVMSRLSRARRALQKLLRETTQEVRR